MAKKLIGKKNSVRAQKQRRIAQLKIFLVVFVVALVVVGLVWLVNREIFRINDITVKGLETLDSGIVISQVRNDIEGKYIWVLPKNSILLYPKQKIIQNVYDIDHRIMYAETSVNTERSLVVSVQERVPEYEWCDVSNKCIYADADGYLFRETNSNPSGLYLVLRGGIFGDPLGQHYSLEYFANIKEVASYFESKKITLSEVLMDEDLDYVFRTKQGLDFYVDFNDSVRLLISRLDVFISQNMEAVSSGLYRTVDVRFGKKIFFTENKKGDSE